MVGWQDKSYFEINKAVAEIDSRFESCIDVEFFANDENCQAVDVVSQGVFICTIDYCDNPSDAWSIMMKNKISVEYDKSDGLWVSHQGDFIMGKFVVDCGYRYQHIDENPLRAAMIVYLEMNNA